MGRHDLVRHFVFYAPDEPLRRLKGQPRIFRVGRRMAC